MQRQSALPWERLPNEFPDGMTLSNRELIDECGELADDLDAKTLAKYRLNQEEFAAWLAGRGKALLEARPLDTKTYLNRYLKTDERARPGIWAAGPDGVKLRDGKGNFSYAQTPRQGALSPGSRKGHHAALKLLYGHCAVCHDFDRDPLLGVKAPKVQAREGLVLNRAMIRRFLKADGTAGPRCRVQAYLMVYTAGRAGAFRFVLWDDVDLESWPGTIHFSAAKHGREYTLYLHPELQRALLRWREEQRLLGERHPKIAEALANRSTAYVLLTEKGKPLSHTTIGKQAKWRAARAGILLHGPDERVGRENKSGVHPHMFRRPWATLSLEDGAALDAIQEFLNHKDISTTRLYARTRSRKVREVALGFSLA